MDTQLNTQTTKKNRGAIIAAAVGAAICLIVAPLFTQSADATLSNGDLCISAHSTTDPEIRGMAGRCEPKATEPSAPVYDRVIRQSIRVEPFFHEWIPGVGPHPHAGQTISLSAKLADGRTIDLDFVGDEEMGLDSGIVIDYPATAYQTAQAMSIDVTWDGSTQTVEVPADAWYLQGSVPKTYSAECYNLNDFGAPGCGHWVSVDRSYHLSGSIDYTDGVWSLTRF